MRSDFLGGNRGGAEPTGLSEGIFSCRSVMSQNRGSIVQLANMRRRSSFAVSLSTALVKSLACFLCVNSVQGNVNVNVRYNGSNITSANYSDENLFSKRYNYISASGIEGHLFLPTPVNACSYVDPPPGGFPVNSTWIALVYDYPSCPSDMVMNVRNAGYKLIIASSRNNSHRTVSKEVSDTLFPIVIIKEDYADYLKENATSDFPDDPILVVVKGSITASIVLVTILGFCCQLFCCCGCFAVCCCCLDGECECCERLCYCFDEMRDDYEPLMIPQRLGRRELTESIQRHINDLQLDFRMQIPLGRQLAQRLPMRKYTANGEASETCAICVDEFTEEDQVRVLPCNHIFHPQCIDEWLGHHSSLCPLCKKRVPRVIPLPERSEGQNVSDDSVELVPHQGRRRPNQLAEYGSV